MSGARQTRFIDEVEMALSVVGLLSAGQVTLQRTGADARFFELLGRAGSRGETFDMVALAFGGFADGRERSGLACARSSLQTDHLIPAREDLLHNHALAPAQVRQALLHALDFRLGSDGSVAAPSRFHSRNVIAL